MLSNVALINTDVCDCFSSQIVNERTIRTEKNMPFADASKAVCFLNTGYYNVSKRASTSEVMRKEQLISSRVEDVTKVKGFMRTAPEVFASSSELFVIKAFETMRNGLMQLSLDKLLTDVSTEDDCLFMYGQKKDVKLFFNLFFEKNAVEALVNVSTPRKNYVIEDSLANSIRRLFDIFYGEL